MEDTIMARKTCTNIYIAADTKERLQKYAEQHHKSMSQAITDWIWSQPVDEKPVKTEMEEK